MKKISTIILLMSAFSVHAQNVGIGTISPTENLEIKNSLRSALKINSAYFNDTAQLILSNRDGAGIGTEYLLTAKREQGLFFSTRSDLSILSSDSLLVIRTNGNVGINVLNPSSKLEVNGAVKLRGNNALELGAGIAGKETNAGKIGYNSFSANSLDIVGAGSNSTNRKVYFFAEGGTYFNGPVNAGNQILLNGNAGIAGQILTSNGTNLPSWETAAFSNDTRFGASYSNGTTGGGTLTLSSTKYNTNTTDIVIGANGITFNKTGLYHFNGNYSGWVSSTNTVTTSPEFSIGLSFSGGSSYSFSLQTWKVLPTRTATLTYYVREPFSQDFYIVAPTTLQSSCLFLYTGSPVFTSGSLDIFGYRISD